MKFWLFFFFIVGLLQPALPANSVGRVAVLDSRFTLLKSPNPAFYAWEMTGALQTLRELGVSFTAMRDEDLTLGKLRRYAVLILPGSKNMSRAEVDAVREYTRTGGKVLATGFASYRDERDQPAGTTNNFQLSDLYGADYLRLSPYPPQAGYIQLDPALGSAKVATGRNTAIQIRLHSGSRALGFWLNDDARTLSQPLPLDAAIVENEPRTALYVGENLFAPENASSLEVRKLLALLLNRLVPGVAPWPGKRFPGYPVLPSFAALPEPGSKQVWIEVGLPYSVRSGFVTCDAPFQVLDASGRPLLRARKGWTVAFDLRESGFLVGGSVSRRFSFAARDSRFPLKLVLWHGGGPGSPFKFGAYRGEIILKDIGGEKVLVNRLPLEAYLFGVLSHEVPFYFHPEALKTMSVVARTFALRQKSFKKFKGYDICATVKCQAYEGLAYEADAARGAVKNTEGEVLLYDHHLPDLPYHATCGGMTEDVEKAWPLPPVAYLRSVVDGEEPVTQDLGSEDGVREFLIHPPQSFCRLSSRYRWKETYGREELEGLFKQSLPEILKRPVVFDRLLAIEVTQRTPHGRATALRIRTNRETFDIPKDQIRWLTSGGQIGLGGLQSTLFVIEPELEADGNVKSATFLGGGWGHGIGLCQFGAQGMALRGYLYEKILSHYFPGTRLEKPRR